MKFVYWADPMLSGGYETLEQEFGKYKKCLDTTGINYKIKYTESPPLQACKTRMKYDVLFFDWGGMSVGNSLLEHYTRYILSEAIDMPSTYYVMCSVFTANALKDAKDEFSGNFHNVYLDFYKFCDDLKNQIILG